MTNTIYPKPDYVHHLVNSNGATKCAVTFINEYQALTAAHCLFNKNGDFNPHLEVMLKFKPQSDPTQSAKAPIVAACYHHEFPDFLKQIGTPGQSHINPASLAPFDFAVIHIGGVTCQGDNCGERESERDVGTSLREQAAVLGIDDAKFEKMFETQVQKFPAVLHQYLELERYSGAASQQEFLTRLESNFSAYVEQATITGVGAQNTELNGEYRLKTLNADYFKYFGNFGVSISQIDLGPDGPDNGKGDSGSVLFFTINDTNNQFFAPLRIPRPYNPTDYGPSTSFSAYMRGDYQKIFAGVNSGLSKKYGTYSLPQSIENQIILQTLVWPNVTHEETLADGTKRPISVLKRGGSGRLKRAPYLDVKNIYSNQALQNTLLCKVPENSRLIQEYQAKLSKTLGLKNENNCTNGQPCLKAARLTNNPNYMTAYFDYIKNAVNDPQYIKYAQTVNSELPADQPMDFMPLVVLQSSFRKSIDEAPTARDRFTRKFLYSSSILDWTSALENGIELFPVDESFEMKDIQKSIGQSIFYSDHANKKCVGSVINIDGLIHVETNRIYGMLPLHCLSSSIGSIDEALVALNLMCESDLTFAVPDSEGSTTLTCRGPEDNKRLARFPIDVYANASYANSQLDFFLFPLEDSKYAHRALRPQSQREAAPHQKYNFYGAMKEKNRNRIFLKSAAEEVTFNAAFVHPQANAEETAIMPHRYFTEEADSGSIIVGHNDSLDSAEIICMHIGALKIEDRQYLEAQGKKPDANRCIHMSILNSVLDLPAAEAERVGDFASVGEPDRSARQMAPETIEAVPVTAPSPPVATNVPVPPMVAVLTAGQDVAPVAPVPPPNTTSGTVPPASTSPPTSNGGSQLTCSQCTINSDCFCCNNPAGLSCNLRTDYPTASKPLAGISLSGQIPHVSASSPMVYRIKERVRTDSVYPIWFKVVYNGQESWVWSGQ